jgi:TonB family protein
MKAAMIVALLISTPTYIFAQSAPSPSTTTSAPAAPRREHVAADTASSLVLQKAPIHYPDAARNSGIQGTVVLKVVTDLSGNVQEATVVSGDPALAQAAADTVKQWKYKPYAADGSPAEMETEVSIKFQIKAQSQAAAPPPLGTFRNDAYVNDYFNIFYPLSRDWVRQTGVLRSRVEGQIPAPSSYWQLFTSRRIQILCGLTRR